MNRCSINAVGCLPAIVAVLAGCYDADKLLRQRAEVESGTRLEEVDLGEYRVTLPHVLGDATDSVVDFHAFGQVTRRDRDKLATALAAREPELRSKLLLMLRGLPDAAYEEPKLTALRQQIAEAINRSLDKNMIKQVGFFRFTFERVE